MLLTQQRRPAVLYLFTFLAMAGSLFVFLCFLPDNAYIRYQMVKGTIFERAAWIFERIDFDPTPIDIAILGNSRTGAAINSPLLEELLNDQGQNVHSVNLSIPASGYDVQWSVVKRLLQEKSPRVLLIAVTEQLPRDGHQAFADLADPIDIMEAPLLMNRNFARNIVYLPMRQIRCLSSTVFSEDRGYSPTWNERLYAGSNRDIRQAATGTHRDSLSPAEEDELKKESKRRRTEITKPVLPDWLHEVEFGVSEYYLKQIVGIAKSRKIQVCFLFLPFYSGFEQPLDQAWLESQAKVLNARFLGSDWHNYVDAAHASDTGSNRATRWLAGELMDVLRETEKK